MPRNGVHWILTIPHASFTPYLPPTCSYIAGQLETGESGFLHWQVVVTFSSKTSLRTVKEVFGDQTHAELTRSSKAREYVHKDQTAVANTRFELGRRTVRRNSATDWAQVRRDAISGKIDDIEPDIFVRHYNALRRIRSDYARPSPIEKRVVVYWGATGTGKTKTAYENAGSSCYFKDPRTKFWCGYNGEKKIVIDEFRGAIDIAHLLRWFDRYPVTVELKGSSTPLCADEFWVTSNLEPSQWYPEIDEETRRALNRRLTEVVEFTENNNGLSSR